MADQQPPRRNFFDEVAHWLSQGREVGLRTRLAQLFALLGTVFAILQLLFSALDLANRAVSSVVSWFRYLVPALLILGALIALYVLATAHERRQKLWSVAVLALVVLAGGGWGGWTYYQAARPPKAVIIVVADFDAQQTTRKVDWGRRIYERVKEQVAQLNLGQEVEVQRVFQAYGSAEQARANGSERKATLVLWGWYDDLGVSPHFEVLRQPQKMTTRLPAPPQDLEDFDVYVKTGPQEMTYIVEVVLGLVHYTEGKYTTADSLFTVALAGAPASSGMLGLEVPHFYRANARTFARQPIDGIVSDLQAAVTAKPAWWQAHWNLALAYSNYCAPARTLDQALSEAQKVRDLQPNDADAQWLVGLIYSERKEWSQAQAAYRQALRLKPDHIDAQEGLAQALSEAGQTGAAQAEYQRALALREGAGSSAVERVGASSAAGPAATAQRQDRLGYAYLNAGQYAQAISTVQAALHLQPNVADYHRHLGNAYYWQGKSDANTPSSGLVQAIAEYETARSLAPDDALLLTVLGGAYVEAGRPADALKVLQEAVQADACDDEALFLLANQYDKLERPADAEAQFSKLTELNPRQVVAWQYLATSAYLRGDYTAAAKNYRAAIAVKADAPDLFYGLGTSLYAAGDYSGAEEAYRQDKALAPKSAAAWAGWGDSLARLNRRDEAIAAYEQAVSILPDYLSWVSLATLYEGSKRWSDALGAYDKAVALQPNQALAQAGRGHALQQLGKQAEAAAAYEQALKYDADNAFYWESLTLSYAAQNRPDDALGAAGETLQRNPESGLAYLVRAGVHADRGERKRRGQITSGC